MAGNTLAPSTTRSAIQWHVERYPYGSQGYIGRPEYVETHDSSRPPPHEGFVEAIHFKDFPQNNCPQSLIVQPHPRFDLIDPDAAELFMHLQVDGWWLYREFAERPRNARRNMFITQPAVTHVELTFVNFTDVGSGCITLNNTGGITFGHIADRLETYRELSERKGPLMNERLCLSGADGMLSLMVKFAIPASSLCVQRGMVNAAIRKML